MVSLIPKFCAHAVILRIIMKSRIDNSLLLSLSQILGDMLRRRESSLLHVKENPDVSMMEDPKNPKNIIILINYVYLNMYLHRKIQCENFFWTDFFDEINGYVSAVTLDK